VRTDAINHPRAIRVDNVAKVEHVALTRTYLDLFRSDIHKSDDALLLRAIRNNSERVAFEAPNRSTDRGRVI